MPPLGDAARKREILAEAGCPSYWLIEPGVAPQPPKLTAYELVNGECQGLAAVSGDESFEPSRPFPVTVVPGDLLDD